MSVGTPGFAGHLETAFQDGCGISFDDPDLHRQHRELVANRSKTLRAFLPGSPEAEMLRVGAMGATQLLNRYRERRAIRTARGMRSAPACDENALAWVKLLGRSTIDAAKSCLPESFVEAALTFNMHKPEQQIYILTLLMAALNCRSAQPVREPLLAGRLASWVADVVAQRVARVLPKAFGPQANGADEPNCVGKAELVLAFARLAGARAWAITSVVHPRTRFNPMYRRLAAGMADRIGQADWTYRILNSALLDSAFRADVAETPEYFHLGTLVELSDGSLHVVDAHQGVHGTISDSWKLSERLSCLDRFSRVHPGLVLAASDNNELDRKCRGWEAVAKADAEECWPMLARARSSEDLLAAFAASKLFDTLRRSLGAISAEAVEQVLSGVLDPPDRPRRAMSERRVAATYLLCHRVRAMTEARWRKSVNGEALEARFPPESRIADYILDVISLIPTYACNRVKNEFEESVKNGQQPFVRFDVGDPEMLVGRGVLAHLAALIGGGEEVTCTLAPLVTDRLMLLAAATQPLRTRCESSIPLSRCAAAVLRQTPFHSQTIRDGLASVAGYLSS